MMKVILVFFGGEETEPKTRYYFSADILLHESHSVHVSYRVKFEIAIFYLQCKKLSGKC